MIVALETGRSSGTAPLDAVRLAPGDDAATVTAGQVRGVVTRLIAAGHWQPRDPDILLVADASYDGLAWRSCWPTSTMEPIACLEARRAWPSSKFSRVNLAVDQRRAHVTTGERRERPW
ncbi:hypothetical protein AB0H34_05465 [Saccharopolyspora shandongensis]|uniref:transposase n=1 Tax=Saccharopolyspora shandongensis TaxID=418495 RepID=UPI0033D6DDEE